MQENCKLLVLTSSFKGENTTMSFPLNCNVARAAFGFCRFSPKEKITLADSTLDLVLAKESLVLCK